MKLRILVCGGTGFIGTNLVNKFKKRKNIILTATYLKSIPIKDKNVRWIKADLRNKTKVYKIIKNQDIIIQAAATTSGAKDILNKPYLHVTDNAIMNSLILQACYDLKVSRFIFFSCTVMYPSQKKPLKEIVIKEKNIYKSYFGVAKTKLYVEDLCRFYSTISKIKYTCIRHSNIYGPHDKFDLKKSHFFGATINKIFNSKNKLIVWGKGTERRDLLYIDDLINFVEKVIKYQKSNFRIYNCGYGKHFSINEIVSKINFLSRKNLILQNDLSKKSIKTSLALNTSFAKKELGWKRKTSLKMGILKTLNWYKKNYL